MTNAVKAIVFLVFIFVVLAAIGTIKEFVNAIIEEAKND